ncbi:putative dolichyl-diphosphooligosaccharide--protein glycosyltransferase subunit 3B-like [Capsicum annuum]|nr:putative dolichyl-diphosphooligosaccharide--protein glycosyltransferase subunit 3B-like [Capsicum annuum]KAF3614616.1 putative dolichyl-diphosphooligosaccharide--protein glycosyltransferase subunit 3B-like [Capsicum annuum]
MKCFSTCFRTNSNHKKISIKSCSTTTKINSISPQALQDLLETCENGNKDEAQDEEIVKSITLIEKSKDISSRENFLEFEENGEVFVEAIDIKKDEARYKIVNSINLFEESKKNEEDELHTSFRKKVTFDLNISINQVCANYSEISPSNLQKQNGEEKEEANELSNSSVSSYISYPPNHRYHCCRNSTADEFDDIDLDDNEDVECPRNGLMFQEESSSNESLFSLSIDSTRRGNNHTIEIDENMEVNSPLNPTRNLSLLKDTGVTTTTSPSLLKTMNQQEKNVDVNILDYCITYDQRVQKESNLKCQENEVVAVDTSLSSQLKDTGITTTSPSLFKTMNQQEKENIDVNILDYCITYDQCVQKESSLKRQENEVVAVDTSLSSWLVQSSQDDTPNSKNSGGSVGNLPVDRPILGALRLEELKDEKNSAIGTIGSYLRHTGQQATGISSY